MYVPFIDPMTGVERPVPYGFGLVRFDGANTNVYHLIDETDPRKLRVGLPVEPVWRDRPSARLLRRHPLLPAAPAASRRRQPIPTPDGGP